MEIRLGTWSVLPAAIVVGVLLALAWLPRRSPRSGATASSATRLARALGALAFAAGYAVGHQQGHFELSFAPREFKERIVYVALGAAIVGALEAFERVPRALRPLVRAVVTLAIPWWLLQNFLARWEIGLAVLAVVGLGFGLLVSWSGLDALARRRSGPVLPLALLAVTSAQSVALLASGNATFALFAASLAGCLGASAVVALRAPALELTSGASAVIAVVHGCHSIGGSFLTTDFPTVSAVSFGLAPLAAWLGEWGPVRRLGPLSAAAVAIGAALLTAALGLAFALANAPEASESFY